MLTRLSKELKLLLSSKIEGISASPTDDNMKIWHATITGPSGTPYEGGTFKLILRFPDSYPFEPPKVNFITRVYHCNINHSGEICLDILKDAWSAALKLETILISIRSLLAEPNPDNPLLPEIGNLYVSDRDKHDKIAKKWTADYAK